MKTLELILPVIVAGSILVGGCGPKNQSSGADTDPAGHRPDSAAIASDSPANAEVKTYHAHGTPRKIDVSSHTVVIEHEKIEGFMDAMTMPFTVSDPAVLARMTVGTPIDFTLRVAGWEMEVTDVQPGSGADTGRGASDSAERGGKK